jgi:hypothetical protein
MSSPDPFSSHLSPSGNDDLQDDICFDDSHIYHCVQFDVWYTISKLSTIEGLYLALSPVLLSQTFSLMEDLESFYQAHSLDTMS